MNIAPGIMNGIIVIIRRITGKIEMIVEKIKKPHNVSLLLNNGSGTFFYARSCYNNKCITSMNHQLPNTA